MGIFRRSVAAVAAVFVVLVLTLALNLVHGTAPDPSQLPTRAPHLATP